MTAISKNLFALAVVALVASTGLLGYTYVTSSNSLANMNAENTHLTSAYAAANLTIAHDLETISDLWLQVQAINAQIVSLNGTVSADASTIASLQATLAQDEAAIHALNAQVASLQAASVAGRFQFATQCSLYPGCHYPISGYYVNYGLDIARNTTVTFNIWSLDGGKGQLLCTTTVNLGDTPGRTITGLPPTTCYTNSPTPGLSETYAFSYI